jgi:hypothetical protein
MTIEGRYRQFFRIMVALLGKLELGGTHYCSLVIRLVKDIVRVIHPYALLVYFCALFLKEIQ